jgi:hypothetical protein
MVPGLSSASAQRYLEAAGRITRELERSLPRLIEKLMAAAQAALSSSSSPARGSAHPRALSLAQCTGVLDAIGPSSSRSAFRCLPRRVSCRER